MHLRYASSRYQGALDANETNYLQTVIKDLRKEAASNKRVSNVPPATGE
jgi:hypothetical protein